MDSKMGQLPVSFTGRYGEACRFHALKHLRKDPKVKVGGSEGHIAKSRNTSHKDKKQQARRIDQPFVAIKIPCLCKVLFFRLI